jgi:UDP:flavonoid glycosyltransferase YjiC (YdhE family)
MEREKIKLNTSKTILIAPLDWGLGHATRCMPLIDLLLKHGNKIIIAGNGDSFYLLKNQYPTLQFYELPGYNISYSIGKNASFHALMQTPKILKTIREEQKAIADIATKECIDLIISDNRYGVRHPHIKSIIICHQIALQAPKNFRWTNSFFLALHLKQLRQFDALWIPDEEGDHNLSGILSHAIDFKMPSSYIGIQSRFANFTPATSFVQNIDFSILVVLSGPEPQRTYLENLLKLQLAEFPEKILLVQGKTANFQQTSEKQITTISYLNTNDLFIALQKAKIIICRSGYSTIMDLAALGKKAILIPSEGQTEQEYLAETLQEKKFTVACSQNKLDIKAALEKIESTQGFPKYVISTIPLEQALGDFL